MCDLRALACCYFATRANSKTESFSFTVHISNCQTDKEMFQFSSKATMNVQIASKIRNRQASFCELNPQFGL